MAVKSNDKVPVKKTENFSQSRLHLRMKNRTSILVFLVVYTEVRNSRIVVALQHTLANKTLRSVNTTIYSY